MGFIARHRPSRATIAVFGCLSLSAIAIPSSRVAGQTAPASSPQLVGIYDGGQMEMGVGLRLQPNGRFDYMLAYGALDESASGRWTSDHDTVYLTSDPVTPPRFTLLGQQPASDGKMHLILDLPRGWTRQYLDAEIGLADGRVAGGQLSDDSDVIQLAPNDKPVSLRVRLDVYDIASDSFHLNGSAASILHVRFDPNDLGKVAFAKTPLHITGKTLTFERYGRSIVFKPTDQKWETE
ncbi:hypothetical protein [Sphingomonas asaccharolytica]|uniref:hypothetical protein n=1 Tax=Sphingomonas asaccharolytica TaxID=40681 RepID=UPI000A929523|nr:hypothetical protein [Sphingomonas asaccharolytica]